MRRNNSIIRYLRIGVPLILTLFFAPYEIHSAESPRNTPIVKVVKECSPSVVNISTEKVVMLQYHPYWKNYGNLFDSSFDQFPRATIGTMTLKGVGSGVIVSDDGLIITNAHVVNMANKAYVILSDGSRYEAALVAINQNDDLALLKISSPVKLKPIKFADDVMIGETVVAIGNPFGLENSVSSGIVSGTNRRFYSNTLNKIIFDDLIQTDASTNVGNSGGALLNLEGSLVGINLAVIQQAQSIGFAIPVEKIKNILKDYREFKKQQKAVKIPIQ